MAPEIFRGEKYDAAVDIYSLGIVMYKLLNGGRMPFMPVYPQAIKYKDSEDALEKRISGAPLPMPLFSGDALGAVVLKACAFNPKDRYASAADMEQALDRALVMMSEAERAEFVTLDKSKKSDFKNAAEQLSEKNQFAIQSGQTVGIFNSSSDAKQAPKDERTVGIYQDTERKDGSRPEVETSKAAVEKQRGEYYPKEERAVKKQKKKWGLILGLILGMLSLAVCSTFVGLSASGVLTKETTEYDSPSSKINGAGNSVNQQKAMAFKNTIIYENGYDNDSLYIRNKNLNNDKLFYSSLDSNNSGVEIIYEQVYHVDNDNIIKTNTNTGESIVIKEDVDLYSSLIFSNDSLYYLTSPTNIRGYAVSNLYYISYLDGADVKRMVDVSARQFTIYNGWIYYIETFSGNIYAVELNGENKKLISDVYAWNINVSDGYAYFCDRDNSFRIMKREIEGSEATAVSEVYGETINVIGDWIYYTNVEDANRIYRISVDGTENTKIGDVKNVQNINIAGGWIFYDALGSYSHEYYRMKLNGTENQEID